jgi:hypothetical protein
VMDHELAEEPPTRTIAERARYQRGERQTMAEMGLTLPDERTCRECGCSDHLACFDGCWWVEVDLCSLCAQELDGR